MQSRTEIRHRMTSQWNNSNVIVLESATAIPDFLLSLSNVDRSIHALTLFK